MTALETRKQILNPRDEKVFYNPVFTHENDQITRLNNYSEREGVFTYGQLLDEVTLRDNGRPYRAPIINVHDRIIIRDLTNRQEPCLVLVQRNIKFKDVTQKLLYAEILKLKYKDHHSSAKWVIKLQTPVEWDKVWETVHNRLATETTKSIMHATYSYNKWHNRDDTCPLCLHNTNEDKFHILLECPLTTLLWKQLYPILQLIHPDPVTEQEMVFGMLGKTPAITLRN